jgi:hypothetical protein
LEKFIWKGISLIWSFHFRMMGHSLVAQLAAQVADGLEKHATNEDECVSLKPHSSFPLARPKPYLNPNP